MSINVYVEICREGVQLPEYANTNDACMDIRAAEDIVIRMGETKIVPTGLKIAIPLGYELEVRPRSGISLNTQLRIANSPGTIDSGYRDEIGIIITNDALECNFIDDERCYEYDCDSCPLTYSLNDKGKRGNIQIKKGDRIAQIKLSQVPKIKFTQLTDITTIGNNRSGGFGSTGIT